MSLVIWCVGMPAVLLLVALVFFYNRLVKHVNGVKEAWSGIDVQLKRRHDLIPRLVEAVRAYSVHESAVLENVTRLRTEAMAGNDVSDLEQLEQNLSRSLQPMLALVEAYPELKADQSFLQLHEQLVAVEDTLQMARRYYNGTVRDHNNIVEGFPGNVVAALFGFRSLEFFEVDSATERAAPQVSLG